LQTVAADLAKECPRRHVFHGHLKLGDRMMAVGSAFNWIRVVVAVILAETLPILLLVAIVFVYSGIRQTGSLPPKDFAPLAGNWVGPIGGFLATFLFASWAARRAPVRKVAHGVSVGVGTAVLDLCLGILLGAGGAIPALLFFSNGGRILAGVLGGWLEARRSYKKGQDALSEPIRENLV
jgi:hypothetical protein